MKEEVKVKMARLFWTPAATIGPMLHECRAEQNAEAKTAIRNEAIKLVKKYYAHDKVNQDRWLRAFEMA